MLDPKFLEKDLYRTIQSLKEVILNHMGITEKLTDASKGTRKSYLEVENGKREK